MREPPTVHHRTQPGSPQRVGQLSECGTATALRYLRPCFCESKKVPGELSATIAACLGMHGQQIQRPSKPFLQIIARGVEAVDVMPASAAKKPLLPDELVAVVKRDWPTCS